MELFKQMNKIRHQLHAKAGLLAFMTLLAVGCGGGGGGGGSTPSNSGNNPGEGHGVVIPDTSNAPFGLSARPALSALSFPTQPSLGPVALADPIYQDWSGKIITMLPLPGSSKLIRIYQDGTIEGVESGTGVTTQFATLSPLTDGEQGLLGLAIDPNFISNHYIYVYYTTSVNGAGNSRVSRFTLNSNLTGMNAGSEKVLFQTAYVNSSHKAGALAFDDKGNLLIALGDDHISDNAQNLGSYYGKILRITPAYTDNGPAYSIPSDNPFVNTAGAKPEIWAYGFRNPFKMSFDPVDKKLWVGDVGEMSYEEIDIVTGGNNYGWPYYEGKHATGVSTSLPASRFTMPIYEYGHDEGLCIIGGFVYRGNAIPGLVGQYVFGDFSLGTIWALKDNRDGTFTRTQLGKAGEVAYFAGFGLDAANEMYVMSNGARKLVANGNASNQAFPARLSSTGLFTNVATLTPQEGLIEYQVNTPLWSDNAVKTRWMAIPNNQQISFSAAGNWSFPAGTVLVKHFEMEMKVGDPTSRRRLETRVLVAQVGGSWRGATYRWNSAQTDADLLETGADETLNIEENGVPRQQAYHYPTSSECLACHTQASGYVLGVRSEQLNKNFAYSEATDNQLRTLNHIGLFNYNVGTPTQYPSLFALDSNGSTEQKARSYLAANCSFCHQPNGPTPVTMDFRFATANNAMNAINVPPQGPVGAKIIAPGSKEDSAMYLRINSRGSNTQMPPLGSSLVDDEAVSVIGQWIDSLK
ncbi:MAG TPA: PQQ-dependent sugar dehydrogenase [Pseudomonadales bacterium]|nr:PQQ-dependent sugar dehydrogenase [Pseudomonadales bacterium]